MYCLDRQRRKMDRQTDKQAEWHADRKRKDESKTYSTDTKLRSETTL